MEKPSIWAKVLQKWLFVTIAIKTVDVSNKNDHKLDETLIRFQ